MATRRPMRWRAGSGKKSNQKRPTDRRRAMEDIHRASISRSEPAMVHMGRHAVVVIGGIPAAAHAPGAPTHIVGVLVIGVARFVVGTGAGLGVGIGGMREALLREGRHCQRGIRGDGGNTEKRKFGHGYLPPCRPGEGESDIRKKRGSASVATTGKAFVALTAQANTRTLTSSSPLRIIVTTSEFRSPAVPATNGDEPVDAMNLVPLWRGPTKETFIEA